MEESVLRTSFPIVPNMTDFTRDVNAVRLTGNAQPYIHWIKDEPCALERLRIIMVRFSILDRTERQSSWSPQLTPDES